MKNNVKNSTVTTVACAIVFLTFVFCYVYFFQCDLLTLAQYVWSGGQTRFKPVVGATIITAVLYVIHLGVKSVFALPRSCQALSYFPSMLFLGVITSIEVNEKGILTVGNWWWISSLLLVFFMLAMKPLGELASLERSAGSKTSTTSTLLTNMSVLSALMLMVMGIGNCDRELHQRLKLENLIANKEYQRASEYKVDEMYCDSSTTMMRAYALSKSHKLGEKLFIHPVKGGSLALVPHYDGSCKWQFSDNMQIWMHLGGIPRADITDVKAFFYKLKRCNIAKRAVDDYILCASLIDCDLNSFAKEVVELCDTTRLEALPQHYREALVLYTHMKYNRILTYKDEVLDADYEDFVRLSRGMSKSRKLADSAISDAYQGTYWYYYQQNSRKKQK